MQIKLTIRITGQLPNSWSEWSDNMEICLENEHTVLRGVVPDQAALHGILNRIRNLNLNLISVSTENL